ncbi:MAG: NADH-quinone oxidoreductase subunit J [Proteobacteria bacterium]|nr:NADH-quinone oxidoreductase subunit J [Pseudomonadota bacterium]MDA1131659.1 NADH-quinone oxidoreductase subunit J [Pseudomonadota bacterium]
MMLQSIAFYAFAGVLVGSAVLVIAARNPVHSVLFLVLAFISAAGLFVLLGAEFLAMILVIVYVGAVAVLFLFVVMMLDINFVRLRQRSMRVLSVGAIVGLVLMVELVLVIGTLIAAPDAGAPTAPAVAGVTNTVALGDLLYTRYIYLFQASGLVLLVGMIGAIVLTHRKRVGVRKQSIAAQVGRKRSEAVELKKVTPGSGV